MKIDASLTCATQFTNANGEPAELFISHLDANRFNAAYSVLGEAYTMIKSGKLHPDVLCVDYREIFKDKADILNAFLEYHFTNAMIISNDVLVDFNESPDKLKVSLEKAAVDDECLDFAKGLFFFIAVLARYANKAAIASFGELFSMSLTLQEWRTLHESSLKQSQTDSDSNKGADKIVNI